MFLTKNILSLYFLAGYPFIESISLIINKLEKCGIDLIEIGLPFSDPVADGNIIKKMNKKSLQHGMNTSILFYKLKRIKYQVNIPLIVMVYSNQFFKFGEYLFLKQCVESGISGIILPDLPLEIFIDKYQIMFKKYNFFFILLACTKTSKERLRKLSQFTNVFLYLVSSLATTGNKLHYGTQNLKFFKKLNHLKLKITKLIGFGILNKNSFKLACHYANGSILGSAFIKSLKKEKLEYSIEKFMQDFK